MQSECEERLRGARLGRSEQCDRGHAGKLPHHACDLCGVLRLVPRDRNEYRGDTLCAEIDEQFVETFAVECFVASLSCGIDALSFCRRQERDYRTVGAELRRPACVRDRVVWNDIRSHGASRDKWTCSPAREVRINEGESTACRQRTVTASRQPDRSCAFFLVFTLMTRVIARQPCADILRVIEGPVSARLLCAWRSHRDPIVFGSALYCGTGRSSAGRSRRGRRKLEPPRKVRAPQGRLPGNAWAHAA